MSCRTSGTTPSKNQRGCIKGVAGLNRRRHRPAVWRGNCAGVVGAGAGRGRDPALPASERVTGHTRRVVSSLGHCDGRIPEALQQGIGIQGPVVDFGTRQDRNDRDHDRQFDEGEGRREELRESLTLGGTAKFEGGPCGTWPSGT